MNHSFVELHKTRLDDFTHMSKAAGSRSDYVQGGGGNTSCKLDDHLMAIKASGFRLDQITPDTAYAVLDYDQLRDFYQNTDVQTLADVEKIGSQKAKDVTLTVEGLAVLRPSVEAGFHSVLETYVLHSHSVYANLVACACEGREIAAQVMAKLGENYAFVPYINPGAQLTFAIDTARKDAAKDGLRPSVIFMQNHGVIVTSDDASACLTLHDRVNQACADFFGVSMSQWPQINVKKVSTSEAELFTSDTTWLKDQLLTAKWDLDFFTIQALYPDQLVFLTGQMTIIDDSTVAEYLASGKTPSVKATVFRKTGEVLYHCGQAEAQTIEETLCAIFFITQTIKAAGYKVNTMDEAGKEFIKNWESEQYRRTIAAK